MSIASRSKDEACVINEQMTRKALESILAAIPALQSLHMSLSNPSSSTRSGDTKLESSNRHHSQAGDVFAPMPNAKVAFRCTMPEVHSVKLAGQFRQGMKLDAVMEGEDLVVRGKQLEEEQDAGEEWIDEEPGIRYVAFLIHDGESSGGLVGREWLVLRRIKPLNEFESG